MGGMGGGDRAGNTVVSTTLDEWEGTFAVNPRSVWLCLKHEIQPMVAA
jgi:NAD(P)-dependent dehydrogenase (short-subunit alcohol dehydrogenase family)